ncbi:hypothetical protein COB57_05360 [Candidatus Peregrinibacteria bacterium]|nr:MAG: hypothetical protein COB57_05360 [Candidatus Peregrinibacteria bacterium]
MNHHTILTEGINNINVEGLLAGNQHFESDEIQKVQTSLDAWKSQVLGDFKLSEGREMDETIDQLNLQLNIITKGVHSLGEENKKTDRVMRNLYAHLLQTKTQWLKNLVDLDDADPAVVREYGVEVFDQNETKGYDFIKEAEKKGDAQSKYHLAHILKDDPNKAGLALQLMLEAADANIPEAWDFLGEFYNLGAVREIKVERNPAFSGVYYFKAVALGNLESLRMIEHFRKSGNTDVVEAFDAEMKQNPGSQEKYDALVKQNAAMTKSSTDLVEKFSL